MGRVWIASDGPVCAISETASPHRMEPRLAVKRSQLGRGLSKLPSDNGHVLHDVCHARFSVYERIGTVIVYAEDLTQSPHMRGVAAVQKVYPDTAVDNNHLAPRPVRLRARLPRQRYLPNAASTSRCRRSLIINRRASSTVFFLVACPEVFWASLMRTSSISLLVRMGHIPCRVYPRPIFYTTGPNRHPEVQWEQRMRSNTQLPRGNESRPRAEVLNAVYGNGQIENISLAWGALLIFIRSSAGQNLYCAF